MIIERLSRSDLPGREMILLAHDLCSESADHPAQGSHITRLVPLEQLDVGEVSRVLIEGWIHRTPGTEETFRPTVIEEPLPREVDKPRNVTAGNSRGPGQRGIEPGMGLTVTLL